MKTLFIAIALLPGLTSLLAQNNPSQTINPTNKMSTEEANRLNGKVEPTYQGGKPYSQWVAEQKRNAELQSKTVSVGNNPTTGAVTGPDYLKIQQQKTSTPNTQVNDAGTTQPTGVNTNKGMTITENKTPTPIPATVNLPVGSNAAGIPTNNVANQQVNSGQNVPAGSINGMIMPAGANTSNQDTKPAVQQIRVPVTPVQDKPVVNDSKTTNGTTTPNPAMEKLKVTSSSDGTKPVEVKQKN